jgi:hypothetical protein
MTVTAWLSNYPWSDPIFQNFEVQQYLSVSGVNPAQTYDAPAPVGARQRVKPISPAPGIVDVEAVRHNAAIDAAEAAEAAEAEAAAKPAARPARKAGK